MPIDLTLTRANVLRPEGWSAESIALSEGFLSDSNKGREIDLSDFLVMPGLVDIHGDGFERHMAPRRGALREAQNGVLATAGELAINGITTAVMAQFMSWEGGMRGPDFAEHVFETVSDVAPTVGTDLRLQLRLETHLLDDITRAEQAIERFGIRYVVFNDHLPHKRLAEGRKPPRLVGQALKSGRSPETHLAMMMDLHARTGDVPAAMDALCSRLTKIGVQMGSHDDRTAETRAAWRQRGASISEFPETEDAAQAARDSGDSIVLGAPNVVRGASHAGNVSARDLVANGLADALASDYHYPALRQAAWLLAEKDICDLPTAWRMISDGPAKTLGLHDRGRIEEGLRADLVILDANTKRVAATIAGGQLTYMSGNVAERFFG